MKLTAADSFTLIQAHKVKDAGITLIDDNEGRTGVFSTNTAKRLGTISKDGLTVEDPRAFFQTRLFWIGVLFGFSWAATIALVTCRHWLQIHA